MAEADQLKELKSVARKIARARRIKHVGALDLVAKAIGYPHWKSVAAAEKNGWRPGQAELDLAEALLERENPFISIDVDPTSVLPEESFEGTIMGHAYRVNTDLDDVHLWGKGWEMVLPEAPLAPARYKNTDRRLKANPVDDARFRNEALVVATEWRKRVHARIASDWPRRSTVPDAYGLAEHPLHHDVSAAWFCLHCDERSSAEEIASNLFHCPHCLASPINIFSSPWWLGDARTGQA